MEEFHLCVENFKLFSDCLLHLLRICGNTSFSISENKLEKISKYVTYFNTVSFNVPKWFLFVSRLFERFGNVNNFEEGVGRLFKGYLTLEFFFFLFLRFILATVNVKTKLLL
jgi:hypothetical protein